MNDAAANSNSLSGEIPTQPASGSGMPAANNVNPQSLNALTTMQHAIALQQFQFQQSLVSQQLSHAVNIKAAAEQAAVRAAEISSRLLKGEKTETKKDKAVESSPKREKSESQSHVRSPSLSQSSRSKSVSPIRYRHSRPERERYSPREHSTYMNRRYSGYYGRGREDYWPSYRGYADRSHGRSYSYYRGRNTSMRRTRRSPSRSLSPRYRRGESPRRYSRNRSPSPRLNHRKSARGLDRHSLSRSPIGSSSLSRSPVRAKDRSPKRPTDRRSLPSSRSSQSRSTTSLLRKENNDNLDGSSSENNNPPNAVFTKRGKEAVSSREKLRSNHSSSSAQSESSSADHSGEKNIGESGLKRAVSGKCASAGGGQAGSSTSSDIEAAPKASEISGGESEPMHIRDGRFIRRDEDGDKHDEGSPYSLGTEIGIRAEAKDHRNRSGDVISVEDVVNDSVCTIKQKPANQEVQAFEYPYIGNEHSGHSSSKEDELKNRQGCDVEATVMLPDGFTWDEDGDVHNFGIPTSPQSMKKWAKQTSRSKERRSKHRGGHRKRRRRDESEEDFDSKKEIRRERKQKKYRKKTHRRHERSQKERKKKKTKHRAIPSSSSEYSSSSDGEYTDVAPSKRSTGHKKERRRGAPSAVSSSSE